MTILDSSLIIGGKAFGLMGTDELRRDLSGRITYGGPPLALCSLGIVSCSMVQSVMGLIYGVYAGFKGKFTDESL